MAKQQSTTPALKAKQATASEKGTIILTVCGRVLNATTLVADLPLFKRINAIEHWLDCGGDLAMLAAHYPPPQQS